MTPKTKAELKRCLDYIEKPNPEDPMHHTGIDGAIRGAEDWFLQSLLEDIEEGKIIFDGFRFSLDKAKMVAVQ